VSKPSRRIRFLADQQPALAILIKENTKIDTVKHSASPSEENRDAKCCHFFRKGKDLGYSFIVPDKQDPKHIADHFGAALEELTE
jgi:hypothetical protein